MPHAENGKMSSPIVNGEKPSSKTLTHITSYPVVSDGIETFKSNPYGAKSISMADQGYKSIVAPVLPYTEGIHNYVAPYVAKADELGDSSLKKVDDTFPIVKEDAQKIKGTIFDYAYFPFKLAGTSKDYVLNTYGSEYKKCGGDGYVAGGKAVITTGLVVTSDSLQWLSQFLAAKKQETKSAVKDKTGSK